MLFLGAKVIPVNPHIHGNVMCPLFVLNFIFEPLFVHAPDIIVFLKLKQSINIRCTQHFLYFESHKKSLKQLHIIICFSVLSISSAFTISTYFINECIYLIGLRFTTYEYLPPLLTLLIVSRKS
jgi:hypothetical protein